MDTLLNVVIVGAGRGGSALIQFLYEDAQARIMGVIDKNGNAPGIVLAKKLGIPTAADYEKLATSPQIHFIIDTTGDKNVGQKLRKICSPHVEILGGTTARFLWNHIVQKTKIKETTEEMLIQYQSIYDVGLKLSEGQNLSKVLFHTLEDATKLTHTHAGSIALFDERVGEMYLGTVKGFSDRFTRAIRWKLRTGGLTHTILNSHEPLIVPDLHQYPQFDNPLMLKEGMRALIATRLISEGRIIGILYVNDFVVHKFTQREAMLLTLLGSIAANIIDKAVLLENAMRMSITDDLTGLFNHRYFMQRLIGEVKRAKRYKLEFSLVMMDIDDFKQYNDHFGHPRGNDLLRQLSEALRDIYREADVLARYGGDEFAVIIPETKPEAAFQVSDRIREKVAAYPFEGREKQPGGAVTISAGVASFPTDSEDPHLLIKHADYALYEAKRLGKNKVMACCVNKDDRGKTHE